MNSTSSDSPAAMRAAELALSVRLKVPETLGFSRREWADRIGLKLRSASERRSVVLELGFRLSLMLPIAFSPLAVWAKDISAKDFDFACAVRSGV